MERRELLLRGAVAVAHSLALSLTVLTDQIILFPYALLGWLPAAGLKRLWGPRTKPKATAGWGLIWLLALGVGLGGFALGPAGFGLPVTALTMMIGLFSLHDKGSTPSLLLGSVIVPGLLFMPEFFGDVELSRAGQTEAWYASWAVLLGVVAAVLERECLARASGRPTGWSWTGIRLSFVASWTFLVVGARGDLNVAGLFSGFGIDPASQGGQIFLFGVLLASAVVAVIVFSSKRPTERP
jgi:hypothetical protein